MAGVIAGSIALYIPKELPEADLRRLGLERIASEGNMKDESGSKSKSYRIEPKYK